MDQSPGRAAPAVDTDADRYVTFPRALQRILDIADVPNEPIERLEATCLADGSITYRYWVARAEFPEGGYLEPRPE